METETETLALAPVPEPEAVLEPPAKPKRWVRFEYEGALCYRTDRSVMGSPMTERVTACGQIAGFEPFDPGQDDFPCKDCLLKSEEAMNAWQAIEDAREAAAEKVEAEAEAERTRIREAQEAREAEEFAAALAAETAAKAAEEAETQRILEAEATEEVERDDPGPFR